MLSRSLPASPRAYGGGLEGRVLALAARATKRAARHATEGLAKLDARHKIVGRGMPKNYWVIASK